MNAKNVREDNPLAVIKFKNTFGVPLESGPLCLFEDDVYVGESMLPRVKVNEEIYAAYAVDLKTTVTMTDSSERTHRRHRTHTRHTHAHTYRGHRTH